MMRTLISNGTVVTAATANEADVVIEGEHVTGVMAPGTAGEGFDRVIDLVEEACPAILDRLLA